MITAQYPIKNSTEFMTITIDQPEGDPESQNGDKRCGWHMSAPNFTKDGYAHGICELQCTFLAFQWLIQEIKLWEQASGTSCEYYFNAGTEFWMNSEGK